jgi:transcription termination factor NusB
MKNTKRDNRITAFKFAYQRAKIRHSFYGENYLLKPNLSEEEEKYIMSLLQILAKKSKAIDSQIQSALIGWRQNRISFTLNTILRLALAENILSPHLAPAIIISEYLEITRLFVGEAAVKLCNGILSKIITK